MGLPGGLRSNDIDMLEAKSSLETALLLRILCWRLCVCHLLTMEPIGIKVRFFTLQVHFGGHYLLTCFLPGVIQFLAKVSRRWGLE
jgi:hypothetical protein